MQSPIEPPSADELLLSTGLGIKGYVDDVPPAQFVAWSIRSGLTAALARAGSGTPDELAASTWLTPLGVDVLLGVLVALGIVERDGPGSGYRSTPLLTEYLVPDAPFFLGESLGFTVTPARLPTKFVDAAHPSQRGRRAWLDRQRDRAVWRVTRALGRAATSHSAGWDHGGEHRLRNQHQRNLPAGVMAAGLDVFADCGTVIDIGGGTGTFAMALDRRLPDARVVIADLPGALSGIERFLDECGAPHVEVVGLDVLDERWTLPDADAVFFGNLLHIFDDRTAAAVLERAARHVGSGLVVVHEVVWNAERTGPLKAALFDVTMRSFSGRQRTVAEFGEMLDAAGAVEVTSHPTRGGYVAIAARFSA